MEVDHNTTALAVMSCDYTTNEINEYNNHMLTCHDTKKESAVTNKAKDAFRHTPESLYESAAKSQKTTNPAVKRNKTKAKRKQSSEISEKKQCNTKRNRAKRKKK